MLVVGAVDRELRATTWSYSRTGRRLPYLDAVAPGYQEVLFSLTGRPIVNHSAAAFATAIASGVSALWRTSCPQTRGLSSADLMRVMLSHTSPAGLDDRETTPAFLQTPGGSWWPDSALQLPNGASCP